MKFPILKIYSIKDNIRKLRITFVCKMKKKEENFRLNTILIIAPHPDDEVLGCGGLIQRYGEKAHVVILTGGGGSHRGCCDESEENIIAERRSLAKRINRDLGLPADNLHLLNYKDGYISEGNETEYKKLAAIIQSVKPDAIFFPKQQGEGWPDHIEAGNIVRRICAEQHITPRLYEYCVWFWYYNVWRFSLRKARTLRLTSTEKKRKQKAVSDYTTPTASCGKPWAGVLPPLMLKACSSDTELYFLA